MTREEAEIYADHMSYRAAIENALSAKCVPYRRATLTKLNRLLSVLESSGIEDDDFQSKLAVKEAIDIVHRTIYQFFDVCEDDEEVPLSEKDKLLLEVNKAICNNLKALMKADKERI